MSDAVCRGGHHPTALPGLCLRVDGEGKQPTVGRVTLARRVSGRKGVPHARRGHAQWLGHGVDIMLARPGLSATEERMRGFCHTGLAEHDLDSATRPEADGRLHE